MFWFLEEGVCRYVSGLAICFKCADRILNIQLTKGCLKKMVKNLEDEKIKRVLTEPKMAAIKAMLEKDHAIDCLLLLYAGRGKWKEAKDFMRKNKLTLSDGTFRARMIEIESLGLAKSERIDPLKKYYLKTESGEKLAKLLLDLFDEISA